MMVKGIEWQNVNETVQGSRLAEYAEADLAEANSGTLFNQSKYTGEDAQNVVKQLQEQFGDGPGDPCCVASKDATSTASNVPKIKPKVVDPNQPRAILQHIRGK